jgi:hypothetical protein
MTGIFLLVLLMLGLAALPAAFVTIFLLLRIRSGKYTLNTAPDDARARSRKMNAQREWAAANAQAAQRIRDIRT